MGLKTEGLDIVYTVKEKPENEELRYSLRSLRNLPHNKVFIYGGLPNCVDPEAVNYVRVNQRYGNKWLNTAAQLIYITQNDNITEDFIWFNDDFFVMKPIKELEYYRDRTLSERIRDFGRKNQFHTRGKYATRLRKAQWSLQAHDKEINNFELHIPMVFNREKLLKVMKQFPNQGAKRSLYGNCCVENPIQRSDVKIYDFLQKPTGEEDFLSTTDGTFSTGAVGKFIRNKFRKASPYERA